MTPSCAGAPWPSWKGNYRDGYTVPAQGLYPYQWCWDSGPIALGWAAAGQWDHAWGELERLLSAQWPSGLVPHIVFWSQDDSYFPGPDVWATGRHPPTTGLTQPPLPVSAAARLFATDPDRDRATARRSEPCGPAGGLAGVDRAGPARSTRGLRGRAPLGVRHGQLAVLGSAPVVVPEGHEHPHRTPGHGHRGRQRTTLAPASTASTSASWRHCGRPAGTRNASVADSPFAVEDPLSPPSRPGRPPTWPPSRPQPGWTAAMPPQWPTRPGPGSTPCGTIGWAGSGPTTSEPGTAIGPATSTGLVALYAGVAPRRGWIVCWHRLDAWDRTLPDGIPTTDPEDPSFDPDPLLAGTGRGCWSTGWWPTAWPHRGPNSPSGPARFGRTTRALVEQGFSEYYDPRNAAGHRRPGLLVERGAHPGLVVLAPPRQPRSGLCGRGLLDGQLRGRVRLQPLVGDRRPALHRPPIGARRQPGLGPLDGLQPILQPGRHGVRALPRW